MTLLERYRPAIERGMKSMSSGETRTLRKIVGEEEWPASAGDAIKLGQQLSEAIQAGEFHGLEHVDETGQNAHLYRRTVT